MRSGITQFAIRTVVAIGIAIVGATAFGMVVAHSAFERAQVIAQETLSKPFQSGPKTEFRLGEHQQLRKTGVPASSGGECRNCADHWLPGDRREWRLRYAMGTAA